MDTTKTVGPLTQAACDIAAGRTPADPGAAGIKCVGAKKDLNAKGNGHEWYRMVYRSGSWQYVSSERLPRGNYLASERRAEVYGDVFVGELCLTHDRSGPVKSVWLVRAPSDDCKFFAGCQHAARRDGNLTVTLPDGTELVVSNPRK